MSSSESENGQQVWTAIPTTRKYERSQRKMKWSRAQEPAVEHDAQEMIFSDIEEPEAAPAKMSRKSQAIEDTLLEAAPEQKKGTLASFASQ